MNIEIVTLDCPDDTYFRASEVRPYIEDGKLHITNGRGHYRSWGSPSVSSVVKWLSPTVIKIKATGWHKHTISPGGGSYYAVYEDEKWVMRRANYWRVRDALAEFQQKADEVLVAQLLESFC